MNCPLSPCLKSPFLVQLTFVLSFILSQEKVKANDSTIVPSQRAHHAMIFDEANGIILLVAGSTPLNGGNSFRFFNDVWSYDGAGWRLKFQNGDTRSGIALAYDSRRKKVFSFGGFSGDSSLSDLRMLNPEGWTTLHFHPEMKAAEAGLVYDTFRDKLIVFGGSPERGKVNGETWEWNENEWIKFTGPSPEPRQAFAMIYDSKRQRTVLFGGMGKDPNSTYQDTWEYDGTSWTKVASNGPSARTSPGFTYDSASGMMIIFGGMTKDGFANDTWGWDGKKWKLLSDKGPAKRVMGHMAYDAKRNRTVLFGGRIGWPNDVNDTWEWDGINWVERR